MSQTRKGKGDIMNQIWKAWVDVYISNAKLSQAIVEFWYGKADVDYSNDVPADNVARFISEKKKHVVR